MSEQPKHAVWQVVDRLDEFLEGAGSTCQVVLVPSTRDVHHSPVFPQPPLPLESVPTRHPQQVTLLPNPATFACNEVVVGVVTSDVVKHLSGQEVQRGPQGDRLPGLAAHLLGQQRYCRAQQPGIHISNALPHSSRQCTQTASWDRMVAVSHMPDIWSLCLSRPPSAPAHRCFVILSCMRTSASIVRHPIVRHACPHQQ